MSQQRPKGNFLQTVLIVVVLFLGFQMIMGPLNKQKETRSAAELQKALLQKNASLRDREAAPLASAYDQKIKEEGGDKLSNDERQASELRTAVVLADTQYKAGVIENDTNRIYNAYMTLQRFQRPLQGQPVWETAVPVSPPENVEARKRFDYREITPQQLNDAVVKDLQARYKTEMVWGIFPGYQIIDTLVRLTGKNPAYSYALAALLLAILVRASVWHLAQKQIMWSRQMSQLQPLVKELREKYGKSPQEFQAKTMELYKEYGINPMSGCLPMLIQLPLFLLVYNFMLQYRFEFKHGLFLWINPAMGEATNGFIAHSLGDMDYVLLVIYGLSMITTTFLSPVSDPANAKQQRLMGLGIAVVFTVMMFFYPLPSAFVLYWIFTNMLSTLQYLRAYRLPMPPLVKVNTAPGGAVAIPMPKTSGNGSMFGSTGTPKIQKPKPKRKK